MSVVEDKVRLPGIALSVSGGLNILYALIYTLWSAASVAWAIYLTIDIYINQGSVNGIGIFSIVLGLAQVLVYLVCIGLGALTVRGGGQMRNVGSLRAIYIGLGSALMVPLLGVLASLSSFLNLSGGCFSCCCGMATGNIGTVPVGLIALIVVGWAAFTLRDPVVGAAFKTT